MVAISITMDDPLPFVKKLEAGATLITPTRRLASACQPAIAQKVWETFSVFSWKDWLTREWEAQLWQGKSHVRVLDDTLSLLCIEGIIERSTWGNKLLSAYETAKMAYAAWKTLHQWEALDEIAKEGQTIDQQAFAQWMWEYRAFLDAHGYIDDVMLPEHVFGVLAQGVPRVLIFYGFEEQTPFLSRWIEILREKQWEIEWLSPPGVTPSYCVRSEWRDERQEQAAAVHFASEQYRAGKKNIAIVIPDLADKRETIARLLQEAWDPDAVLSPVTVVDPHFNISAAVPLNRYPIVQAAFLAWRGDPVAYQSPWLGIGEKCLSIRDLPQHATYGAWATLLREQLTILGWPQHTALTSTEYQAMFRFEELLDTFSRSDAVLAPCDYMTAVNRLENLAAYWPFQPENRGAPIQVLGILEAAGQTFEALWVMGMHNEAWPPPAQPNPFLDLTLQKQRSMPHASAEREMQFACYITERLKNSADTVIFSYAAQNKEQKRAVSELIRALPVATVLEGERETQHATEASTEYTTEQIEDPGMPLTAAEKRRQWPARLLELQAACPFRAMAEYRLGLRAPDVISVGISAAEQGRLVHKILQKCWTSYPHQTQLFQMSAVNRREATERWIEEALHEVLRERVSPVFIEVERTRLIVLLEQYFELEKNRASFCVIHTEYPTVYTISSLTFYLRCDRIDRNENNEKIIIDYKTGKFTPIDSAGSIMNAPQLPLYAVAYNDATYGGAHIVQVRMDQCRYYDLTAGVEYQSRVQEWRIQLQTLVNHFENGDASVMPRAGATTCLHCHLQSVCRIYEKQ